MALKSAAPFRWKWALLAIPALLALQVGGIALLALLGELGPWQVVLVSAVSYFLVGSLLLRGSGGSVWAGLIALLLGMGGAKVGEFLQATRRAT